MLQSLHVKNLALIDETEVAFEEGLNILTGETGAGKSILIGSMNLALGEKVPKEMLRDNDESAYVELVFSVDDPQTKRALLAVDEELTEDTVILSRKITNGRAVGRINGEAASVAKMRQVASYLIDIHGQHEHQSLLSRKKHLELLDAFAKAKLGAKKETLAKLYHTYRTLSEEYENACMDREAQQRELSLLTYEVNEITAAQLHEGEDEQLEEEFRKLANGQKIREALYSAQQATDGDGVSAGALIGAAARSIGSVAEYDVSVAGLGDQLAEIENLLTDFNHALSGYLTGEDFDEAHFYEVERRLEEINRLKSKYADSVEGILAACRQKQERIDILSDYEGYLQKQKARLAKTEQELSSLSGEISEIRKEQAALLGERIQKALSDLNFLQVDFAIDFARTEGYTANGIDEVCFLISLNPGEALRPLDKVASGGELSRIMLAIKTVMAQEDHIGTLIFDEIDSGISGRTAQMVSEKMNELGRFHQLICITHLPQIAAMADAHFLIEKSVEQASTVTGIHPLDEERSIAELARMLGGVEITETVVQSAREMKALAKEKKG